MSGDRAVALRTEAGDDASSSEEESLTSSDVLQATPTMIEAGNKAKAAFKEPASWMIAFGSILAICAGIVNVACILHLNTVVSHMTGLATKIGLHLEGVRVMQRSEYSESWAELKHLNSSLTNIDRAGHMDAFVEEVWIMLSFAFGAFLCGLVIPRNTVHFGGKSFYGTALLGNSALLFLCYFLAQDDGDFPYAACCAAMASGLQNAMCSMHLGAIVRTTHVTGTVTDIGSTSGRAVSIVVQRLIRGTKFTYLERVELDVDLAKLKVLLIIFFAFFLGCYLGANLYGHLILETFLVPAVITGVGGVLYTFFREFMKKTIKSMEAQQLDQDISEVQKVLAQVDLVVRQHSGMKRSGMTQDERALQLTELDGQVTRAMTVLQDLRGSIHEIADSDRDDEGQEQRRRGRD